MNKLKDLVPELELCKQIPEGAFADSALVWSYSCDKRKTEPFVEERDCIDFCRRDMVNAPPVYPAPTLEEILSELILFGEPCCFWQGGFYVRDDYGNDEYDMVNASTAGLKLWLRLNAERHKSDQSDTDRKGGEL